ncbi:MAG: thioredoxin [Hyphomicrobiales bacterium]|nr:thioredoxin [Hyphomicrobiales bacterium]
MTDIVQPAGVADTTTATFRADVLTGSMTQPVLVDFWAPWCGPCKQLAPVLEKAVAATAGKVKLFKMNIDDHPSIAQQLGIQSIPAVIAFEKGQPVDGFMGALPEGKIKEFLDRLLSGAGGGGLAAEDAEALKQAEALLQAGDGAGALEIAADIAQAAPENVEAVSLLLRAMTQLGQADQAQKIFDSLPEKLRNDAGLKQAQAALATARQAQAVAGQTDALRAKVDSAPEDRQARFDLALALAAEGDREGAADALLYIIKRDRAWNEDGARKQLLQFFDTWGPTDDATKTARRKLSALLFS